MEIRLLNEHIELGNTNYLSGVTFVSNGKYVKGYIINVGGSTNVGLGVSYYVSGLDASESTATLVYTDNEWIDQSYRRVIPYNPNPLVLTRDPWIEANSSIIGEITEEELLNELQNQGDTNMSYTKTTWINGETPVNADNMNKIENELESLDTDLNSLTASDIVATNAQTVQQNLERIDERIDDVDEGKLDANKQAIANVGGLVSPSTQLSNLQIVGTAINGAQVGFEIGDGLSVEGSTSPYTLKASVGGGDKKVLIECLHSETLPGHEFQLKNRFILSTDVDLSAAFEIASLDNRLKKIFELLGTANRDKVSFLGYATFSASNMLPKVALSVYASDFSPFGPFGYACTLHGAYITAAENCDVIYYIGTNGTNTYSVAKCEYI